MKFPSGVPLQFLMANLLECENNVSIISPKVSRHGNMKRQRCLLLLVCSVLITGCLPYLVHDYYGPNAADGIVKKSTCGESSGPPDTIEFKRHNVIIKVKVYEVETGVDAFVILNIPKGKTVRLESTTIRISTPENSIITAGSISKIKRWLAEPPWEIILDANEPMIGDTKESKVTYFGPKTYDSYYTMSTTVRIQKYNIIAVQMPIININEAKVQLPEIRFKKDRFLELFPPINC
jgi:hypothetical protein